MYKNYLQHLVLIALLLFISGCQTTSLKKASLTEYAGDKKSIHLLQEYKFDLSSVGSFFMTMPKGEYLAYARDESGIFYIGPPACGVVGDKNRPVVYRLNCGIFMNETTGTIHPFEFSLNENQQQDSEDTTTSDTAIQYGALGVATEAAIVSFMERIAQNTISIRKNEINKNLISTN